MPATANGSERESENHEAAEGGGGVSGTAYHSRLRRAVHNKLVSTSVVAIAGAKQPPCCKPKRAMLQVSPAANLGSNIQSVQVHDHIHPCHQRTH